MFNPGNSNESIYEVQWSYSKLSGGQPQTNTLTTSFDPNQTGYKYQYSLGMLEEFRIEQQNLLEKYNYSILDNELYGRMMYGAYVTDQWEPSTSLTLNGGLRYDIGRLDIGAYSDWFATPDADGTPTMRQRSKAARRSFNNLCFSLGAN